MVKEGKIDTDKPVTTYMPELKGTVWDKVEVIHLLNHTTGWITKRT
ncbi:hypothetical protein JCM19236_3102 [Vibrio sp. JCM 19236]|nr:hypothetical protein JCM19236_3102 [Vibrio sp. JCM 19236]